MNSSTTDSNYQRVTEGLRTLTAVLAPYVAQELRADLGAEWWDRGVLGVLHESQRRDLPPAGKDEDLIAKLDAARCLRIMDVRWNDLFRQKLSREHRTWVKELIATRNKWAHPELLGMADEDAWRALDTMTRLVEQIDAEATERLRALARTVRYGTEGPSTSTAVAEPAPSRAGEAESPSTTTGGFAGSGSRDRAGAGVLRAVSRHGLRPWKEVARPHPDVSAGRYRQAEFAADLSQVARGRAEAEYQDPVEFFARTYLTDGMRGLMVQALRRIGRQGGEPVIQLKTAFGGGKTHSLLALYHLLRGRASVDKLRGIPELLREAGIERPPAARVAVVVGTAINPTRERRPPNLPGITIRTLWGEIAAQLAEQAGDPKLFNRVRSADRKGVPPGSDALRGLFDACGPCLLLIDELVAYARKIYGVEGLPAGSFDAVQTFIQELTEAVRASRNTVLVATIPESDIEIGGDAGAETLARIEHVFGRMEAVWKPVGSEEGFEVVRRRLFLPLDDEAARDEVCRAFGALYRENGADFPPECREARYLERLKACYPIHPEVFERLYGDWSTLERFQRTRGVLRLMAAVIHDLWVRNDAGLLILPGSVGLDAPAVRDELTRYLPEGWTPVLEGDVDGPNAGPFRVDAENPRFGQIVAARRVARTIFLGSAPHVAQQQVRGLEDVRLRLGAVQPGEQVAVFNDAASQLAERLTYLYRKGGRYWYDTRPNLRRTVAERAQQVGADDVERELERRVREATRRDRGDFQGVHACPASAADVPDEPAVRLVVLASRATHADRAAASAALETARDLLSGRGKAPRQHQNMLAFLAPDRDVMEGLEEEARRFLAWRSVVRDHEALNLDAHQRREAADGEKASDETVRLRLREAWRWLLVPVQHASAEGVSRLEWDVAQVPAGGASLAGGVSERMRSNEHLITRWSPALLKMELDRWFWKGRKHVPVKQVWDALCAYCYLPRLRDRSVFEATVRAGLESGAGGAGDASDASADGVGGTGGDYFAYATSVSAQGRYEGLTLGAPTSIYLDASSVLVKPDAARAQLEAEQTPAGAPGRAETSSTAGGTGSGSRSAETGRPPIVRARAPRRFFGTIRLDPIRAGRDMSVVTEEVVQHLSALPGAEVEVSVEISATVKDGVNESVRRIVDENCRALKFRSHGFDEE